MEKYYQLTKEQVLQEKETTQKGLSREEAKKRKEKYGDNQLVEGTKKSTLQVFIGQFKDFLVLILIVAAVVSMFLQDVESAIVILIVVLINAILGTVQHKKAEQSLESLKQLTAPMAKVIRDGEKITVDSKDVTIGDILLLEAGDYICADGRILENYSLKVNESSLTGESLSVEKSTDPIDGEVPIGDRKNMVFSGSFVTYGRAVVVVTGIGMDTEIGHVAALLKSTQERKTPLQKSLDDFGKKLSWIIIAICAILFGLSVYRGEAVSDAFLFAVALAVAAIPEALSSIVTIVLSFGTQKMAKENAIIRQLHAVEGLGSVSVICSDKTGTLTQNKMTVQMYYVDGRTVPKEEGDFQQDLDKKLLYAGILCNDSSNQEGGEIGDPTEIALINFGDQAGYEDTIVKKDYPRLSEVPFDSDRKLMSTVHNIWGGTTMITKGAVDVLLNRVVEIETQQGVHKITQEEKEEIQNVNQMFSEKGLRVLAFAYKSLDNEKIALDDEQGLTFLGLIAMMDPPREESKEAVAQCIQAGIRPVMITGDHKVTASAIAREIGILSDGQRAMEGNELETLTDEQLMDQVEEVSVYARVSPEHKIRIVKAWQAKGNIVAMTGDGVNDAPALRQADIGVAMGITGSEVAKDAASMILTDDNFATIVKAVENGRNLYLNIKKSINFLLSGNTAGILVVLAASLLALPVPFAAVHLLFINLLTDSLPAIALGMEPHSKEVMRDKPRPAKENILTKDFLVDIVIEGLIIGLATFISFRIGLSQGGDVVAMTMAFATLCASRLFHGFHCKSAKPVLFTKTLFSNSYLWGAFAIGFVLLNGVLLIPGLHSIFQVAVLTGTQFAIIYGLSFGSFVVNQAIKGIRVLLGKK